jgi:anaerobic dimethyl sulfoxide reductase subunit C (anchor subunit)
MSDGEPREWPLVVFTLAIQCACGLQLATFMADLSGDSVLAQPMRSVSLMVLPLVALGIVASAFHLGKPGAAWRSLSHLGKSRLSAEILVTGVFAVAAVAYGLPWLGHRADVRVWVGLGATLAGLAAVGTTACVYMVPTRPVWHSWWLPTSFYATALLLGGLAPAILIDWTRQQVLLETLLGITLAGGALQVISALWMFVTASRVAAEQIDPLGERGVPTLATRGQVVALLLDVMLAGVLPAVVVVSHWLSDVAEPGPPFQSRLVGYLVLAAALSGAALGRRLMYTLGTALQRF